MRGRRLTWGTPWFPHEPPPLLSDVSTAARLPPGKGPAPANDQSDRPDGLGATSETSSSDGSQTLLRQEPEHRAEGARRYTGGCRAESAAIACFAAACSASFFVLPVPLPSSSPSICAAQMNCRSCGGPSTSSTA